TGTGRRRPGPCSRSSWACLPSVAGEHGGRLVLVMDGEPVDHRGAGFIEADDFHCRAFAPELEDYLVQCAHGGDVPKVGATDVDALVVEDFLVVEAVDEAFGRREEHLAGDGVGAYAALVLRA